MMKIAIRAVLFLSNISTFLMLIMVPIQIGQFVYNNIVQETFLGTLAMVIISLVSTIGVIQKIDKICFLAKEKFEQSALAEISEFFPVYAPPNDKTGWIYEITGVISLTGVNLLLYLANLLV